MRCPTCGEDLIGLGTWCHVCEKYTVDTECARLELVLPLPPNLANARMHWAAKSRQQRDYRLECDVWHPKLPRFEDPVTLTATLYLWNRMDEDNLTARLKWPLDWLVRSRVIVDDHPDCLTLGTVSQEIDRKDPRLELTLTVGGDDG